jgi:hypothetical protein
MAHIIFCSGVSFKIFFNMSEGSRLQVIIFFILNIVIAFDSLPPTIQATEYTIQSMPISHQYKLDQAEWLFQMNLLTHQSSQALKFIDGLAFIPKHLHIYNDNLPQVGLSMSFYNNFIALSHDLD